MTSPRNKLATLAACTLCILLTSSAISAQNLSKSEGALASTEDSLSEPKSAAVPDLNGLISGTVTDTNGDLIPGSSVTLDGPSVHRTTTADDNASFTFSGIPSSAGYRVVVHAKGFVDWSSKDFQLAPGQVYFLTDIKLPVRGDNVSVEVFSDPNQLATEEVKLELQQRVLGVIPNFYVAYKDSAPLNARLKFKMALRVSTDPVTIAAVGAIAAINQAGDTPGYVQGAKGYGQRFGAEAATSFSGIMIGAAILPSVLHQDPRYFYQGTGSVTSRTQHAMLSPFICRSDSGHRQINFSSMGGDLASDGLANLYYPKSDRGADVVLTNFAIGTVERMASALAQEFILGRFTKKSNQ